MHPVEFFHWWLPADPEHGRPKRERTRWKMSRATAAQYPSAEPDESSREVRQLPDGPDELDHAAGVQRRP